MIWHRAAKYEIPQRPFRARRDAPYLGRDVYGITPVGPQDLAYDPLRIPQLFREFAYLETKALAYLDFANRYGLLGLPSITDEDSWGRPFESLDIFGWSEEQGRVWRVVNAWDVLNGDDEFDVEPWLLYKVSGTSRERRKLLGQMIIDGVNGARVRLQMIPRLEIREQTPDSITFFDNYAPTTLIGAIWTQVIRATTMGVDYLPCANECGRLVERSPAKRGPKARYCSDLCRADFNQRAAVRARQMLSDGKSVTAIAAETKLTRERVKRIAEVLKPEQAKRQPRR